MLLHFTEEQLLSMRYYEELLPLYKLLRAQGIIRSGTKVHKKRTSIVKQIITETSATSATSAKNGASKGVKSFHTSNDKGMLKARAQACENYLEEQQRYIEELESNLHSTKSKRRHTA